MQSEPSTFGMSVQIAGPGRMQPHNDMLMLMRSVAKVMYGTERIGMEWVTTEDDPEHLDVIVASDGLLSVEDLMYADNATQFLNVFLGDWAAQKDQSGGNPPTEIQKVYCLWWGENPREEGALPLNKELCGIFSTEEVANEKAAEMRRVLDEEWEVVMVVPLLLDTLIHGPKLS